MDLKWSRRDLTLRINAPLPEGTFFAPNRFFDFIRASYYVTDNFRLSIGHRYTFGSHALTLGAEHGVALGGGRMASLFAEGEFAEGDNNAVLGGLRIYFGQHDKSLIERHRQDDPLLAELRAGCGQGYHIAGWGPDSGQCVPNGELRHTNQLDTFTRLLCRRCMAIPLHGSS